MTGTKERLADALAARAEAVDSASVRPLPDVPRVSEWSARRRRVWLVPVAAAVSVAVIAAVVGIVAQRVPQDNHERSAAGMSAALPDGAPVPLPPYFIGIYNDPRNDLFSNMAVYDAATGAVIADTASSTHGLTFTAVAATASRAEFLAAAEPVSGGRIGCGATLYEVKLTAAGRRRCPRCPIRRTPDMSRAWRSAPTAAPWQSRAAHATSKARAAGLIASNC